MQAFDSFETDARTTPGRYRLMSARGFTLVEMLVVISIIAVLVAVLIPALQKSRDAARKIVCQSQMRQFYLAGQAYTVDHSYWPASTVSYTGIGSSTFSAITPYIGVERRDYRKNAASELFWVCPSNPVAPDIHWQDVRDNLAYETGSVFIGNYWTTHYFGMSASSFWSLMVPIDMVPANRKLNPKPMQSMEEIVWLGELRGVTYSRWMGSTGNMVFFHPRESAHVVMMNGSVHDVTGNPTADGWRFYK